MEQTATAFYFN